MLALLGSGFTLGQYWASQDIAKDNRQEATLKTYLDDMSDLLLNHNLSEAKRGDNVSLVAKGRTLATLQRLDANHSRIVLLFLHDTHLLTYQEPIVDLKGAVLSKADLKRVDLSSASLDDASLEAADLEAANLTGVHLHGARLTKANLHETDLSDASLLYADLTDANLTGADLHGADLGGADLTRAYLDDKTKLTGTRYNTKEIPLRNPQGQIWRQLRPTIWPQGFDPKTHEVKEDNTVSGRG